MALSLKQRIIADLATDLGTIATPTHTFRPQQVFTHIPNDTSWSSQGTSPAVYIWAGAENKTLQQWLGGVLNQLEIHIVFLGHKGKDAWKTSCEMAADVESVIVSGNAHTISGSEIPFEVEPIYTELIIGDEKAFLTGGHSTFLITYTTRIGDPRQGM